MSDMHHVGRRLSYASARCTVRYFGEVQGTTGEWLGVEWDDHSRGKHDGSHGGVKYFDCQSESATAASFIRPSRTHDTPVSFLEALAKKYTSEESAISQPEGEILISGKVVEEVGFEKARRQLAILDELRIVLLDGICVVGVRAVPWIESAELHLQEKRRIADQNLKIVELDLSRNLVEKWIDIISICNGLKSLRILKVNSNRLRDPSLSSFAGDEGMFHNVEELSLDDTFLSWDNIVNITSRFPTLTSLSVSSNNISAITAPLSTPRLKILNLGLNTFRSFADVSLLTTLPSLTNLSLRSNPLKSVLSQPLLLFPNLTHLDLTLTLIPSDEDLSPLAVSCPSLSSILTNKTPLSNLPSSFLFTIARLSSLTSINHSPVNSTERQNAELYYLSLIAREISAAPFTEVSQVLDKHPRYKELCEIYGEPEIANKARAAGEPEAGTLGARIIRFTFWMSNIDEDDGADRPEAAAAIVEKRKDIPRTVDVYQLKGVVGRLFGLRPMGCRLIWETGEWDPVKGEEDGWSCSEEEELARVILNERERKCPGADINSDEDSKQKSLAKAKTKGVEKERRKGKWTRRETELVEGTRDVGFWIEGREARVRVERIGR